MMYSIMVRSLQNEETRLITDGGKGVWAINSGGRTKSKSEGGAILRGGGRTFQEIRQI